MPPATQGAVFDKTQKTAKIGVAMVNWNGWQDTITAHKSLQDSDHQDWVLIVVDNASSDDSLTHLRKIEDRFHLVESPVNTGFTGACNVGIREAEKLGLDYVYFMNNDAVVEPDVLTKLVTASRSLDDQAILGSVVRYQESGALQFYGSVYSEMWGKPDWFPLDEARFAACPELIESDCLIGASMFAPLDVIKRTGDFDGRFFLNYEELDWCYRALALGIKVYVVKSALMHHKGSATLGSLAGPLQIYFRVRNEMLFCEKHGSRIQLLRAYKKFLKHFLIRSRDAIKTMKLDYALRAYILAVRDYVFRRFGDCPPIIREFARKVRAEAVGDAGHI